MEKYELECRYDSRQSFYGKAWVHEEPVGINTSYKLYSYGTLVAKIIEEPDGKLSCTHMGKYSQTTSRHQREFFRQFGLSDSEIKFLEKNVDAEVSFE